MSEKSKLIRETILILFNKKGIIAQSQIDELFECGVITDKSALRCIIKSEYWEMLKSSNISTRSAIIDLSIKWDVCETSIKNIIYSTPQIKV